MLRCCQFYTLQCTLFVFRSEFKMAVFWVVVPCSLVEVYRRFRGTCCLHHQGATTQKTAPLILTAVRTRNPTEPQVNYASN
jgi:hypothetical protein